MTLDSVTSANAGTAKKAQSRAGYAHLERCHIALGMSKARNDNRFQMDKRRSWGRKKIRKLRKIRKNASSFRHTVERVTQWHPVFLQQNQEALQRAVEAIDHDLTQWGDDQMHPILACRLNANLQNELQIDIKETFYSESKSPRNRTDSFSTPIFWATMSAPRPAALITLRNLAR